MGETPVGIVPEPYMVFAAYPAEMYLAAIALRREIDQPLLHVSDDDSAVQYLFHAFIYLLGQTVNTLSGLGQFLIAGRSIGFTLMLQQLVEPILKSQIFLTSWRQPVEYIRKPRDKSVRLFQCKLVWFHYGRYFRLICHGHDKCATTLVG